MEFWGQMPKAIKWSHNMGKESIDLWCDTTKEMKWSHNMDKESIELWCHTTKEMKWRHMSLATTIASNNLSTISLVIALYNNKNKYLWVLKRCFQAQINLYFSLCIQIICLSLHWQLHVLNILYFNKKKLGLHYSLHYQWLLIEGLTPRTLLHDF